MRWLRAANSCTFLFFARHVSPVWCRLFSCHHKCHFCYCCNQMLLWIICGIQNFLLTQKLAWTPFLRTLNFLPAVPYAVQKIVTDAYSKCSGIYKIKSTKIQCKWFYKLHWSDIIKHTFIWNVTRTLQALRHTQKQTSQFEVGNKGLFMHQTAALCFVYKHTSLPCTIRLQYGKNSKHTNGSSR